MIATAMILAAGRGERLKSLTQLKPKALCLVQGIPLIEHHISNLAKAGFKRIIINHAHLGGQIRQYLGSGEKWQVSIDYLAEPPGGLETGGGLLNACNLLIDEPFLSVNADIYTDFNFKACQLPKDSLAHLVLGPNPVHQTQGNFGLNASAKLCYEPPLWTYLGIAVYHPMAFANCKMGRYSVIDVIKKLMQKNLVSAEVFSGLWIDVGTVQRLKEANQLASAPYLTSGKGLSCVE